MPIDRRSFLRVAGAGVALAATSLPAAADAPAGAPHPSAHDALAMLLAGNARFVSDKAICPPLTARRLELSEGQSPFAIIVSCSDSRVPVETVFDQIPGNIFGVRIAGNFLDDNGLGSIEYSVAVLKSSLILVLGHTDCGAVKAAVKYVKDGTTQPSHIQGLVTAIAPAVKSAKAKAGDLLANSIVENVHENVRALTVRSPIVAEAVKSGSLAVAGGVYDLNSGKVTVIT